MNHPANWPAVALTLCGIAFTACDHTDSEPIDAEGPSVDADASDSDAVDPDGQEPDREDADADDGGEDPDAEQPAPDASPVEDGVDGGPPRADAGSKPVCGRIRVLGAATHDGVTVANVSSSGAVAAQTTTDREGKYCLPVLDTHALSISRQGKERLRFERLRVVTSAGEPSLEYCSERTIVHPVGGPPHTETICDYPSLALIEVPRLERVLDGGCIDILPGDENTFLFTHNQQLPYPRFPSQQFEAGHTDLSRGFFDGRPPERLASAFLSHAAVTRFELFFTARTVQGNMFFFGSEASMGAVPAASGRPIAVAGWRWFDIFPDGKSALLLGNDGVRAIDLTTFNQNFIGPATTWGPEQVPSSRRRLRDQRYVRFAADGWVYFWDAWFGALNVPRHAALRRARAEGGPSELVANDAMIGALEISPDARWIAWGEPLDGGAVARVILARTDGSELRRLGEYTTNPTAPHFLPAAFDAHSMTFMGALLEPPSDPALPAGAEIWPMATGFAFAAPPDATVTPGVHFIEKSSGARHFLGPGSVRGTWDSWIGLASGDDPKARTLTLTQPDGSEQHTLPLPVADLAWIWMRGRHVLMTSRNPGNAAGGTLFLLHLDDLAHPFQSPFTDSGLQLSPDGSRIVFYTDEGATSVLRVVTFEGQELAHIPNADSATFSPDGSRFVFMIEHEGAPAVASLDAAGSVRVHARGAALEWLSNSRLLVGARFGDVYALDLSQ